MEPGTKGIVTAMSIQMKAVIWINESFQIRGELHSRYLETPYVFNNLFQMVHKMEDIFDTNGFPQAFLSPRSFSGGKRGLKKQNSESYNDMNQNSNVDSQGAKCTFEISVRFRQNATWQGQILWAERNMKQNFRSVLEMLRLMDEALLDADENQKPVGWHEE